MASGQITISSFNDIVKHFNDHVRHHMQNLMINYGLREDIIEQGELDYHVSMGYQLGSPHFLILNSHDTYAYFGIWLLDPGQADATLNDEQRNYIDHVKNYHNWKTLATNNILELVSEVSVYYTGIPKRSLQIKGIVVSSNESTSEPDLDDYLDSSSSAD